MFAGALLVHVTFKLRYWKGDKGEFAIENDFAGRGWPWVYEQYITGVVAEDLIESNYKFFKDKTSRPAFRAEVLNGMLEEAAIYSLYEVHDMPGVGILTLRKQSYQFFLYPLILDALIWLTLMVVGALILESTIRRREARAP